MVVNRVVVYRQHFLVHTCIYISLENKLIKILRNSNSGCRYGNHYMGLYCYVDDLILLSPTYTGLQVMLNICERYAQDHDIIYNAKNS